MTLKEKLKQGKFVVTAELNPPKGTDLTQLYQGVDLLKGKVDACNITDGTGALMKAAPVPIASLVKERGIEPILQLTCRDRNRMALQSELLGAWCLGVRNMLALGGDPIQIGDHPEAKPVYDLDTLGLIKAAKTLSQGKDLAGKELTGSPDFFVAAAANPGADDLDSEMSKTKAKIDAGADFFQTQAVFEQAVFDRWWTKVKGIGKPMILGVILVKSVKMAQYMNKHIPGVHIPDPLMKKLDEAPDKAEACVEIASSLIRMVKGAVQGVHIMAIGWEDKIPAVLKRCGLG
ncbi:MAG: methylenetetrahydrofolate reductase [Candidatus Omnitrophica bacterium]|nr:methylenetetrahydrofolate reductase [Candidatus Omnitrophota bacterium]